MSVLQLLAELHCSAITESGETPDEIATALQQAEAEGQGNFTLADVLGNSGQRMLSSVARAPGEGRTKCRQHS